MALNRKAVQQVVSKVEASLARGRFEEAAKQLAAFIAQAEKADEKKELPELLSMLGQIETRFEQGAPRARATLERAFALQAEQGGEEALFSLATDAYAALRSAGRHEESLPFMERAAALYEKANGSEPSRELVIVLDNLAASNLLAKRPAEAEAIFARALALAAALEATEGPSLLAQIQVNRIELLLEQGRLPEIAALLSELEPKLSALDAPVAAQVHYRAAQLGIARKDLEAAKARLLAGIALLEPLPKEQSSVYLRAQISLLARVEEDLKSV